MGAKHPPVDLAPSHRTSLAWASTLSNAVTRAEGADALRINSVPEMIRELLRLETPSARKAATATDPRSVLAL